MTDAHGMDASPEDVEAFLESDFPPPLRATARDLIRRCESLPEPRRVQMAVLELAGGDIASLKHYVERAEGDYRDVLYWAFYPDR